MTNYVFDPYEGVIALPEPPAPRIRPESELLINRKPHIATVRRQNSDHVPPMQYQTVKPKHPKNALAVPERRLCKNNPTDVWAIWENQRQREQYEWEVRNGRA